MEVGSQGGTLMPKMMVEPNRKNSSSQISQLPLLLYKRVFLSFFSQDLPVLCQKTTGLELQVVVVLNKPILLEKHLAICLRSAPV